MINQWTVGKKIGIGYAFAVFLLLAIGGVAFVSLILLTNNSWWVAHTHLVLEKLEGILSQLKDAETGQRGFLLSGDESFLVPFYSAEKDLPRTLRDVRELMMDNPAQQRRLNDLEVLINKRMVSLKELIVLRQKDPPKLLAGSAEAKGLTAALATGGLDRGKKLMDSIRDETRGIQDIERDLVKARAQTEASTVFWTQMAIVCGTLASILGLSVVGYFVTRGITVPLGAVADMSRKIADGDLRQQKLAIVSNDETGQLAAVFNSMLDSLRALTAQTNAVTGNLNASAAEILASTQQQATSTREQAATVQQITTTMEEISQSGAQISGRAKQVAAAAEATSSASTSGMQAVQDTTRTMTSIREQVEEVAENIVALSEKTQAVGEIIATVNDIAERSNLLALNAAIEAAAAGEQGNRFSVVAQEMKNLADQAKDSTVQVRTILSEIQKGINTSVMLTEEAVKRVETGRQQSDVTEQTIRQMASTTLESVQAFEQIIGAGSQQQIGFEQVSQGMKDIRQAATQTAAGTAQLERAVANLNTLSQELKQAMGRYKV
jgi:methyl-accepting chemotaxis protein